MYRRFVLNFINKLSKRNCACHIPSSLTCHMFSLFGWVAFRSQRRAKHEAKPSRFIHLHYVVEIGRVYLLATENGWFWTKTVENSFIYLPTCRWQWLGVKYKSKRFVELPKQRSNLAWFWPAVANKRHVVCSFLKKGFTPISYSVTFPCIPKSMNIFVLCIKIYETNTYGNPSWPLFWFQISGDALMRRDVPFGTYRSYRINPKTSNSPTDVLCDMVRCELRSF